VTLDMEERAAGKLSVDDFGEIAGVRAALEAALADVPEPAKDLALVRGKPSYAELDGHFRDACRTLAEQSARIAELESKLASVREWLEDRVGVVLPAEVLALLDGKEGSCE